MHMARRAAAAWVAWAAWTCNSRRGTGGPPDGVVIRAGFGPLLVFGGLQPAGKHVDDLLRCQPNAVAGCARESWRECAVHGEPECGSSARLALDTERAAHQFDQTLTDRKAEAGAAINCWADSIRVIS